MAAGRSQTLGFALIWVEMRTCPWSRLLLGRPRPGGHSQCCRVLVLERHLSQHSVLPPECRACGLRRPRWASRWLVFSRAVPRDGASGWKPRGTCDACKPSSVRAVQTTGIWGGLRRALFLHLSWQKTTSIPVGQGSWPGPQCSVKVPGLGDSCHSLPSQESTVASLTAPLPGLGFSP